MDTVSKKGTKVTETVSVTETVGGGTTTTTGTDAAYGTVQCPVFAAQKTIPVPMSYITGTLCKKSSTIPGGSTKLFGNTEGGVVNASKGILLYALYKAGEREIVSKIPYNETTTRSEVLAIPMGFLPTTLNTLWKNVVTEWVTTSTEMTRSDVLTIWNVFLFYTVNGINNIFMKGYSPTTKTARGGATDVSKGVLFYTLYLEFEFAVNCCFSTGTNVTREDIMNTAMDILPNELYTQLKNTISSKIEAGKTSKEKVMTVLANFLYDTIIEGENNYVEIFSALWPYMECAGGTSGTFGGKTTYSGTCTGSTGTKTSCLHGTGGKWTKKTTHGTTTTVL